MKIFIAGARSVTSLSDTVKKRLYSIYEKNGDVLIGDCYGVDSAVQAFFSKLSYGNVIVFASNGKVRNNIGNWTVKNVPVESHIKGFDFYKQKDIAMADCADYGFMIWDGKSKGTLNNMINLIRQNKNILVYLSPFDKTVVIKNTEQLNALINICPQSTKETYYKLISGGNDISDNAQLTLQPV